MKEAILVYTPTLTEKLLGKNYKWWYLTKTSFKSETAYKASNISFMINSFLNTVSIIFVWWLNNRNDSNLISVNEILTYFLIGSIFCGFFIVEFTWMISSDIKDGKITNKLLNSSNIWLQYVFKQIGAMSFWNIDILLWVLIAIIGHKFLIIPKIENFILFIFIGILNIFQSVILSFLVGSLAFFVIDNYGIIRLFEKTREVSSGELFPLNLVEFTKILTFTPFAFTFYHPMQIYLGKYNPKETALVFIGGIFWCLFLYLLAKLVFKIGLKRNESIGL